MVVSMGTGTSFVGVKDRIPTHLGGIGIGGGTIIGLSKLMLNTDDIDKIQELASGGKVGHIDLRVGDHIRQAASGSEPRSDRFQFRQSIFACNLRGQGGWNRSYGHRVYLPDGCLISQGTNIKDFILIGALRISRNVNAYAA